MRIIDILIFNYGRVGQGKHDVDDESTCNVHKMRQRRIETCKWKDEKYGNRE